MFIKLKQKNMKTMGDIKKLTNIEVFGKYPKLSQIR